MTRTHIRATTPEQKKQIVEDLLSIWLDNPGLRLGQLIGNVYHAPTGGDPYHVEDYDFINEISEFYAPEEEV